MLATWWNPALNALIASTEYREICNGLEDESIHGKVSLFLIFFVTPKRQGVQPLQNTVL